MNSNAPEPDLLPDCPPAGDESHKGDEQPDATAPNIPGASSADAELGGMPGSKVPRKPVRPERKLSPETKAVADRIVANLVPVEWRLPNESREADQAGKPNDGGLGASGKPRSDSAPDTQGKPPNPARDPNDEADGGDPAICGKCGAGPKPAQVIDGDKGGIGGGEKPVLPDPAPVTTPAPPSAPTPAPPPAPKKPVFLDPEKPLAFQILDIIGWQETGGEAAALGWLLKAEQAEAVARMRSLQFYGTGTGAVAVILTLVAACLAVGSWWIVQDRTGIGCKNHEFFNIPDALWEYSLSSASAVLLCLAAATLLFRVARALFADAAAAFATSDAARRAEASVRFLRLAETLDPKDDAKIRDGMIALGLEFGRRAPSAKATSEEIGTQLGEALDLAQKVKNLVKQ